VKTIIAAILMLASAAAYGQLLKCVSKDGRVEYAARCPDGTTEHKTTIFSKGATSAPTTAPQSKSLAEQDAAFRKRAMEQQEAQQKADKKMAEADSRREACSNAQAYLKTLREGMRVTRTDPKTGERVYLDDAEYAGEIARAQRVADQNCR